MSGDIWFFAHAILQALYNITLHPLSCYPGPRIRGAFFFPSALEMLNGDIPVNWHKLHQKYGDIVRVNPNTLSITRADGWRDVYGHGMKAPLTKDPIFYYVFSKDDPVDIISANDADHARIRRSLNPAFSEQALRSQEGIINSYISLMISKLHKRAKKGAPVDIMRWLNFTTFDITGDLAFDEPFGSLANEDFNSWIASFWGFLRAAATMIVIRWYPIIGVPIMGMLDWVPALAKSRKQHFEFTRAKLARRLASKTERKDFISYIVQNSQGEITAEELKQTSGTLILAGSETTATLLSGAVYFLLKNPEWMTKLYQELQAEFQNDSDITFASLGQLKILNAVLNETFRMYPPLPTSLPRVVPKHGATVCGNFLPPGTQVGIAQYCMYRSSSHFKDPEKYAPNRFLGDENYANDKRKVLQPFSVGPRNCVGQNLAWAELRTILARLIWNFEMELVDKSIEWEKQKVFVLWVKPSLMVKLRARHGCA